jgi:hypothetical protein
VGDFPFFFLVRSEVERETGLFFNRDWLKEEDVGGRRGREREVWYAAPRVRFGFWSLLSRFVL